MDVENIKDACPYQVKYKFLITFQQNLTSDPKMINFKENPRANVIWFFVPDIKVHDT